MSILTQVRLAMCLRGVEFLSLNREVFVPGKSNLDVTRRTLADMCDLEKFAGFLDEFELVFV